MRKLIALTAFVWIGALGWVWPAGTTPAAARRVAWPPTTATTGMNGNNGNNDRDRDDDDGLDAKLAAVLAREGFTGRIESTLEDRLGRPIDPDLADLGRLLWFD